MKKTFGNKHLQVKYPRQLEITIKYNYFLPAFFLLSRLFSMNKHQCSKTRSDHYRNQMIKLKTK